MSNFAAVMGSEIELSLCRHAGRAHNNVMMAVNCLNDLQQSVIA